ncbi:hypothetical protein H0H93_016204 [Arthromyces matolae]|nr:hypothetical protein H0H93_016204 [Arthromyces matolae]
MQALYSSVPDAYFMVYTYFVTSPFSTHDGCDRWTILWSVHCAACRYDLRGEPRVQTRKRTQSVAFACSSTSKSLCQPYKPRIPQGEYEAQMAIQVPQLSSKTKPRISIIIPRIPLNNHVPSPLKAHANVPTIQISSPIAVSATSSTRSSLSHQSTASETSPSSPDMDASLNQTDVFAIAGLLTSMRQAISTLQTTFDTLDVQTRNLAHLAPEIQADNQVKDAQRKLQEQINRHESKMQEIHVLLKQAVCDRLLQTLKDQVYEAISDTIENHIHGRVQMEVLAKQFPERLRQVVDHAREILQSQTIVLNSDARRHNSTLCSPSMDTEPLRPLLRPLPSALQSPSYTLQRPFTTNNSVTPSPTNPNSAVPRQASLSSIHGVVCPPGSRNVFELVPPTPSPLFPRDMRSLFGLKQDTAKQLLSDYALDIPTSAMQSPFPKMTRAVHTDATGLGTSESSSAVDESGSREEDINKFMKHIGIKNALSYATRPLWDEADGPKTVIPHYYAEGMQMDNNACQLHGWQQRQRPENVKVMDAVLMSSELDLLEIRLNELDSVVDSFFIIESNATFTGLPKETYFAQNRERFSKFEKKIVYKFLPGYPLQPGQVAWDVERWTRDNMTALLRSHMHTLSSEDPALVIMSDLDELPSRHTIELLRTCDFGNSIHLQLRNFFFEWQVDMTSWRSSVNLWGPNVYYRHSKGPETLLADSGWHCSYCFRTIPEYIAKMTGFSHYDRIGGNTKLLDPARIQKTICQGKDIFGMLPEAYSMSLEP